MKLANKIICSVAAVIGLVTGGAAIYGDEFIKPVGQVVIEGQSLGELRISPKALEMTGNAEGCRLDPYNCPSGLVTNGIGNTHGVPPKPVSLDQVAKDWVKNLQEAERCISQVENTSGKPMTQGQFDALTSFAFNTGCERFRRNPNHSATRIYSYAIAGNYQAACAELPKWVYGGGKKLPGLINRRGLEYARCMEVD
ncbi:MULTISPECIES: lysozyme [unclassified Vibrio]|uniref:lysozyme n=1 Tax=unclassified Vibrio TaxID=2614977 RepID=UPI00148299A3|nr:MULTISPECIES: lysozyme [unclassified Vibrio]MDQ2192159.1 lysozyme [Vibrio sp. A14(2019)]MDQ2196309.1 lysozyme [Vibrio sp. 2017_1457_11]NNN75645.1 lysozyme [Vibrio sp. B7]NNN92435.1 lysozyme [Vibrio sp. B8-1]NNO07735.1 lysozyme [Vibrio sp. B4-12]